MNDIAAKAKRNRAEKLVTALQLLSEEQRECYENAIIGTAFANSMIDTYRGKKCQVFEQVASDEEEETRPKDDTPKPESA